MSRGGARCLVVVISCLNVMAMGGPSQAQTTTSYSYDNLGRLHSATATDAALTTYNYDAAGNRVSVSLSREPTLWANPSNANLWTNLGVNVSAAPSIDGQNAFQLTAISTGDVAQSRSAPGAIVIAPANGTSAFAVTLQATPTLSQANVGIWSDHGSTGQSVATIISGPGSLSQIDGSRWTVSGLSTTLPTRVRVTRQYPASEGRFPYIELKPPVSTVAGEAIIVSDPTFLSW